jgi:hypothetical protein
MMILIELIFCFFQILAPAWDSMVVDKGGGSEGEILVPNSRAFKIKWYLLVVKVHKTSFGTLFPTQD